MAVAGSEPLKRVSTAFNKADLSKALVIQLG